MNKFIVILITICFLTGLSIAVMSEMNVREGNWEMTIQADIPGMKMKMPPMKYNVCITKDNMNPQKSEKNQDCKTISSKIQGSTFTWVSECTTKEGIMRSEGSITYRGATMNGVIKTTSTKMQMKQTISGRRTAACAK